MKAKQVYELVTTKLGFRWGPLEVMRLMDDPKGGVVIGVMTPTQEIELRASPSGQVLMAGPLTSRVTPPAETP